MMIEFEDHDDESRLAFLHYLRTGKPPEARAANLITITITILLFGATTILPFLAH